MNMAQNNRILASTRMVALAVIPFLLVAAIILFFFRPQSADLFAWEINPNMTAFLMGAGYLGGAYFFLHVLVGSRWRRVAAGFPAVVVYTLLMLAATLIHWDRFEPGHPPFLVWLVLYVVTPVLLIVVWLRNSLTGSASSWPATPEVPEWIQAAMSIASAIVFILAIIFFTYPEFMIPIWPWTLTPLTARVVAGWHGLLGAGGLALARHDDWGAWRVPLTSITIWQGLVFIGLFLNRAEMVLGILNWYLLFVAAGLAFIMPLMVWMEVKADEGRLLIE